MQPSAWSELASCFHLSFMKPFLFSALLLLLLGGGHAMAQTPVLGKDWTLQRPLPTAENLQSIACDGAASMVVVGGHGTLLSATKLSGVTTWTKNAVKDKSGNATTITADLWDVAFDSGIYVAVGSAGTILMTSDTLAASPSTALTWIAEAPPTSTSTDATKLNATDTYNAVSIRGATVVAVGATSAGGGVAVVSLDTGSTWKRYVIPSSTAVKDVTIALNAFYAVMDGYLLSSGNNGATWSKDSLAGTKVRSIAYATPTVPAGLDAELNITGSKSWEVNNLGKSSATLVAGTAPADLSIQWSSNAQELVAVNTSGQLSHSSNGNTWRNLGSAQSASFNRATFFGSVDTTSGALTGSYVAVGDGGAILAFDTSTAVGTWTSLTTAGSFLPANGVAWNNRPGSGSLYVAVGTATTGAGTATGGNAGNSITWTSTDGATWTEHTQTGLIMLSVMWTGTYFVAGGNGLWISSDGVTWTSLVAPPVVSTTTASVYAVAQLGGTPIALGYDATKHQVYIATGDAQGYSWGPFTAVSGATWAMLGVAKSDSGQFVAAGWGGRVLTTTAPDKGVWTPYVVALASGEDFTDILWANGQFTAVTSKGGIWTSTNGSSWTKRKTASQALWCITRVKHAAASGYDDQFIAAGDHGLLVTSFNGQEWQEADLGSSQFSNQILWVPSTTVSTETHQDSEVVTTVTTSYTLDTTAHTLTTNVKRDTATTPITRVQDVTTLNTNPLAQSVQVTSSTRGTTTTTTTNDSPSSASSQLTTAPATTVSSSTKVTQDVAAVTTATPTTSPETLLAAGGYGAFFTSQGTPPVQPNVSFAVNSATINESSGTSADSVTIQVTLSAANPLPVTVTFGFGGTALTSTYKHSVAAVTFLANDTTPKDLLITANKDTIDHHNAQVLISMASLTGDVKKGANPTCTVTINDDEHAPTITGTNIVASATASTTPLIYMGSAMTLGSSFSGDPTSTWQWRKNGIAIAGATQTYYLIPNAALTDAATYTLYGYNSAGPGVSNALPLAVLDGSDLIVTPVAKSYPKLTARVAGPGLSYQWYKNSASITGAISNTLPLASYIPADGDVFYCAVTAGSTTLNSGSFKYVTGTAAPGITSPSTATVNKVLTASPLTQGQVGQAYSFALAATGVSYWTITGLPLGLSYKATTGLISGTPAQAGTFNVTLKATNGTGATTVTSLLKILPQTTNLAGIYTGLVNTSASVNGSLGGRVDVTVAVNGKYTGKLIEAGGTAPFFGTLDPTTGTGTVQLPGAAYNLPKVVSFTLSSGTMTGTVALNGNTAGLAGWQKAASSGPQAGKYTIALSPTPSSAGVAYGLITVSGTGTFSMTGKLADSSATAYATAGYVSPAGKFEVFVPAYAGTGALQGELTISLGLDTAKRTDNSVSGNLNLNSGSASPVYAADGGKYIFPGTTGLVMNLVGGSTGNNARISFTGGGLSVLPLNDPSNPDAIFTVQAPAVVSPSPINDSTSTGVAFTTATGEFTGRFTRTADSQNALFYGVCIRPGGSATMVGKGFFYLPAIAPATGGLEGTVEIDRN